MTTTTDTYTNPYIYISGSVAWLLCSAADEADDTTVKLAELPAEQADAVLSHGFRVIIEGVNDDDTLAA